MRARGVIYLFIYLLLLLYIFFIAVILNRAVSSGKVWNWESSAGRGLEMRSVGRVCGLSEKSANSENSGKIRSERLRRFSASDFAPASQNLNGPSESTTLRVDKLSLYSDIGYNTVDCESIVR